MGRPSVNEFSPTQFPIKNVFDGSPIHGEMVRHCSSTREGKFLQKALKNGPKEIRDLRGSFSALQERSPDLNFLSQFLAVDTEIALS
jgi:hypothetical protein